MSKTYGYCRISTQKQNVERQVRNIIKFFPDAIVIQETFTGSKFQGRKELDKLVKFSKIRRRDHLRQRFTHVPER